MKNDMISEMEETYLSGKPNGFLFGLVVMWAPYYLLLLTLALLLLHGTILLISIPLVLILSGIGLNTFVWIREWATTNLAVQSITINKDNLEVVTKNGQQSMALNTITSISFERRPRIGQGISPLTIGKYAGIYHVSNGTESMVIPFLIKDKDILLQTLITRTGLKKIQPKFLDQGMYNSWEKLPGYVPQSTDLEILQSGYVNILKPKELFKLFSIAVIIVAAVGLIILYFNH